MKEAGIREARQNLTALIEEVRKGHEVTITDRGRPVARLVAPRPALARHCSDLSPIHGLRDVPLGVVCSVILKRVMRCPR